MCLAALLATASGCAAQDKAALTIDGLVRDGATYQWSLAELEDMPQKVIRTSTPWHDSIIEFEGVELSYLMDLVGAEGDTAFVVALNEYTAEVPIADFEQFGPILALRQDGATIPIADKGPFFIVYPYDDDPQLHAEKYYLRSVWSVSTISVE